MKFSSEKKVYWTFAVSFIAFFVIAIILIGSFIDHRSDIQFVKHSYHVQEALTSLLSSLKDAETGQRGYLITGDYRYLEPYNNVKKNIRKQIINLFRLTKDNLSLQKRLPYLDEKINSKIAEIDYTINKHDKSGYKAARQTVLTDRGKNDMDEIRLIIKEMHDSEDTVLQVRLRNETKSVYLFSIIALILFASMAMTFYLLLKYVRLQSKKEKFFQLSKI